MHKSLLPFVLSAVLLVGAGCAPAMPTVQEPVITPEVVTNTNTPTPEAEPKTYTMTEVATHNSETNCWSAIRGTVYDLTSWISQHPGGPENIKKLCGTDGTDFFVGQHGGSPPQENRLAGFEIGTVKQ